MDSIHLKLYIEPKPLKRARHSKQGSFIRTYYDKDTLQEMDTLKYAIINALTEQDRQVIAYHMSNAHKRLGIALKLTFGFVIPQSYSKRRKNELINNPHTNHVDLDNLTKNVLDRGNGILWSDDKYIHTFYCKKVWSEYNFIEIEIDYESTP